MFVKKIVVVAIVSTRNRARPRAAGDHYSGLRPLSTALPAVARRPPSMGAVLYAALRKSSQRDMKLFADTVLEQPVAD